jgi:SAM-dependent methyltransferase
MSTNFQDYSKYYDLLYKNKDYKGESDYVLQKLKKINPNIHSVLELGCGSGNHAQYLCNSGLEVTGIERSEDMIKEALKKNVSGFTPTQGDISAYSLGKTFDAAISLFHVISYLNKNEELIECFRTTYEHLNDNGVFLFDIWYTPAVLTQRPETRVRKLEDENVKITRIAQSSMNHESNVVNVNFEVLIENKISHTSSTLEETHPMRHFSVNEIDLLAKLTGFKILEKEEFLSSQPASEKTWGVCFILQKI